MKAAFQSKIEHQRRELSRLLDENESLKVALSIEHQRAEFFEQLATDAGLALQKQRGAPIVNED